jgi:hypothetical protein
MNARNIVRCNGHDETLVVVHLARKCSNTSTKVESLP